MDSNRQGVGYYWPDANDRLVNDATGDGQSFRTLLRFNNLTSFLPVGASISGATLNLTFLNWNEAPARLQVGAWKQMAGGGGAGSGGASLQRWV